MNNTKIGFIGCGNMGGAIARAVSKTVDPSDIFLCDKDSQKSTSLASDIGANIADIETVASECGYIFLGVKPNMVKSLLDSLSETLSARNDRFVLITMAAGRSISEIKASADYPVIRIMPNTPVSVGEGMILYCHNGTTDNEIDTFISIMAEAGRLCAIDEHLIDAGCAVSGCGPAYVFMFIEAMADGGVRCGLSRHDAQILAAQTLLGSAKLVLESGKHPGELKDAVCSPGGSTIAGVMALENGAFRADAANAVVAAFERTKEL